MKKLIIYCLFIVAVTFTACDPIEDRDSLTGSVTADELDITATPIIVDGVNSNKVVLENHSPVLSWWNYGVGTSQRATDTVLMVVTGTQTITFTGRNGDGSTVTKELTVDIDELSFEVPEQWGYLCGEGSKTWVWDDTQADNSNSGTAGPTVWGNGGYLGCTAPCWWNVSLADVDGSAPGEGDGATMVFSTAGATLTKNLTDGTSEAGTFSFDMTDYLDGWSIGTLKTNGVTVLAGFVINDATDAYEYNILTLDDDYMSLSVPRDGVTSSWGEATFWMFKAQD